MPKYRVIAEWSLREIICVKANTRGEAFERVNNMKPLKRNNVEYIEGSLEIDPDILEL